MIATIKLLYSLISDLVLVKRKRRREIYSEIIVPIFEKFLEVHTNYYNMFSKISDSLPYYVEKKGWTTDSIVGEYFDDSKAIEKIELILRKFRKERQESEFIRDWLRNDTKEILSSIKYDEEKRLLFTILNYFIRQITYDLSDSDIDITIKHIIEGKAKHPFDTPSSRLAWRLNKDPENAKAIVDRSIAVLNSYFFRVSSAYINLKMTISTKG